MVYLVRTPIEVQLDFGLWDKWFVGKTAKRMLNGSNKRYVYFACSNCLATHLPDRSPAESRAKAV